MHYGRELKSRLACHRCDIPQCVNPSHIFGGTIADNNADQIRKGRKARGEQSGINTLREVDVKAIREAYTPNVVGLQWLANQYGVAKKTIANVVHRKTWSHI